MKRPTVVFILTLLYTGLLLFIFIAEDRINSEKIQMSQERIQVLEKELENTKKAADETSKALQDKVNSLTNKVNRSNKELSKKQAEIDKLQSEVKKLRSEFADIRKTPKSVSATGTVKYTLNGIATAYGASVRNGGNGSGKTATGGKPVEGVTIAADPKKLPYGTKVMIECPTYPEINGVYTVQDTGAAMRNSSGVRIDIYMEDHKRQKMLDFGKRPIKVSILSVT